MGPLRQVSQRLTLKLFLAFVAVIAVGAVVMVATAQGVASATFSRHMPEMSETHGGDMRGMMDESVFPEYRSALTEAVLLSVAAAAVGAALASFALSHRILRPVRAMFLASRDMAAGRLSRRVDVQGSDELAALATNFNIMAEALEQTEKRRQQLLADIAHELRTPLTTISSHMEGLMDGVLPQSPETYRLVHREAHRLARLVQDLQELSMAEARQLPLRRGVHRPADLVEGAIARLQPQYEAKGVHLGRELPDRLPDVDVDEDRIIQVLVNVLANALRYTPAQGSVSVRVREHDRMVDVSVQDTGAGIAPEHLSRVFERFYRADESRSRVSGGSGLGLTIAKHIVELHGGRIWAESAGLGRGAVLRFTLPVAGQAWTLSSPGLA